MATTLIYDVIRMVDGISVSMGLYRNFADAQRRLKEIEEHAKSFAFIEASKRLGIKHTVHGITERTLEE